MSYGHFICELQDHGLIALHPGQTEIFMTEYSNDTNAFVHRGAKIKKNERFLVGALSCVVWA